MNNRNFDAEKKLQDQIKMLIESLGVLTKALKESMDNAEVTDRLWNQAMDTNTLYCRFVSDHFEMSSEELSELFDSWMGQFSEEELEEMTDNPVEPYGDDGTPRKIDAECEPKKLWSMDDLLNELNPNEDN